MDALAEVARGALEGGPILLPLSTEREGWIDPGQDEWLRRIDATARLDAPADPPPLDLAAARWGLGRLAHLAQRIIDREEQASAVEEELTRARDEGRPDAEDASHVWSVDLTLRHLASIERQARGLRPDDPVRVELRALARDWPLSGAAVQPDGVSEAVDVEIHPLPTCLLDHPTLRGMYRDRTAGSKRPARPRR